MDILGATLEIEFLIWDPFVPETWKFWKCHGSDVIRRFFGHDDVTTLLLFCWILQREYEVKLNPFLGYSNLYHTFPVEKHGSIRKSFVGCTFGGAELKLNISQLRRVER